MIDHHARPVFQRLFVDPIAGKVHEHKNWQPNHVTLAGCIFGVSSGVAIGLHLGYLALLLLLVSGYLDIMDGTLARLKQCDKPTGAILDIVCDRVVEFSVIFGLFAYAPQERGALCLIMLGSVLICVTSFLVVGIFEENHSRKGFHYSPGLMERAEAFIFFGLMMLLPQYFTLLAIGFSTLVFLTAALRVRECFNVEHS